jgi:Tfp pilus assembly protein PilO
MRTSLRRIFDEKRRIMIPVLGGLALNIVLYVVFVYPLSVRVRSVESRAQVAAQARQAAERDEASARGAAEERQRTDAALQDFYKDILPSNFAQAQQTMFLRLTQVAELHNLQPSRRDTARDTDKEGSLVRMRASMSLKGNYEDIRRFIYHVESGTDFIVIDSVVLRQGTEPGSPLILDLGLSTYYRARPDAA